MSCAEYVCTACGSFNGYPHPGVCKNPKCTDPDAGFFLEWDEQADFEREDYDDDERD